MADKSKIEWTEITWNFITGCTKVSDGCVNCYIDKTMPFRVERRRFDKPGIGGTTGVKLHSDRLHWPLTRWKKPSRIFVNSLADIFHEDVPDQFIAEAFAVMSLAPQHTFQLLTKRHARMRALLNSGPFWVMVNAALWSRAKPVLPGAAPYALSNVHVGVSVENREWVGPRISALRETPAAVRMLSCEPLLGPLGRLDLTGIGWVIAGGESGPGARPMHPDWARALRDQCVAAGVPFFFKQQGQHAPVYDRPAAGDLWLAPDGATAAWQHGDGHIREGLGEFRWPGTRTVLVRRHGAKHNAGRELDGRTWDQFPRQPEAVAA